MQITLVDDPKAAFSREDMRCIDCDVLIDGQSHRYTARADDVEPQGRALYATLMLTPDKITPYAPPKVAEPADTEK